LYNRTPALQSGAIAKTTSGQSELFAPSLASRASSSRTSSTHAASIGRSTTCTLSPEFSKLSNNHNSDAAIHTRMGYILCHKSIWRPAPNFDGHNHFDAVLCHNVHFDNVLFVALILTRCFDDSFLTQCHIDDALLAAPILV
jgi:hypothetical protein